MIPAQTEATRLLNRARGVVRWGTDGCWHWYDDFGDDASGWETDPGTPLVTVAVIRELKSALRLSWPDALEAASLLVRHPVNPESLPSASPKTGPAEPPELGVTAAQASGNTDARAHGSAPCLTYGEVTDPCNRVVSHLSK